MSINKPILSASFVAAVLCIGVFTVAWSQTKKELPASETGQKALSDYSDAVRRLDDDYARKLDVIRLQYVKDLDVARKKALQKDDLDEAQRLLAEKRRAETASLQPGAEKGFVVLCAAFGVDEAWLDITPKVRSQIRNSSLHFDSRNWTEIPDPAPGRHKSMIIIYTVDGKVFASTTQDDQRRFDLP